MSLFGKIQHFALEKGYALLRKKGARCPQCSEMLDLPVAMPKESDPVHCNSCGWSGGLFELMQSDSDSDTLAQQPANSKIVRRDESDGSVSWLMPSTKRPNFLWFFALFWLGITGTITLAMAFGEPAEDASGGLLLGAWLFLLPFWAIGLGVGYWGLRISFMESILVVNSDEVVLLQKLFGKVKKKSATRAELQQVELAEAYRQNERPVYAVSLHGGKGKLLSFGSRLKEDEKRWLVSELREVLGLQKRRRVPRSAAQSETAYGAAMELQNYADLEEISESGLKLTPIGNDGFRIVREHGVGKWLFLGAVFALIGAVIFGNAGLGDLDGFDGEWNWFDLFDALFVVMPLLGALFCLIVCIGLVVAGSYFHGRVETFEFSEGKVVARKGKKHERGKEMRYQRADFNDVKRKESGHVNNDPRYSVELSGKKRLKVHGFLKSETAYTLEDWLRVWLG